MAGFRLERKSKAPAAAPDSAEEVAVAPPAAGEEPASPAARPVAVAAVAERAERLSDGDTVQLNLALPAGLHRRLRLAAVRSGRPLAATLSGLLADHLPEA